MSFRCEICGKAQPAHTAPIVLVTEKRQVNYPERKLGTKVIDYGGRGWEIVRETRVCKKCVKARSRRDDSA